jgi:hypothetical protein
MGQQIPQIYRHMLVLSLAYPGSSSRHVMRCLILAAVAGSTTWFRQEQLAKAATGKDVNISMSSLCYWRERLDPYHPTRNVGVDIIIIITL